VEEKSQQEGGNNENSVQARDKAQSQLSPSQIISNFSAFPEY